MPVIFLLRSDSAWDMPATLPSDLTIIMANFASSAVVDDNVAVLQGLDGRKMSKSYNNTIPLFLTEKKLKKHINKIKTNLLEPGEPKDADDSAVFPAVAGLRYGATNCRDASAICQWH